MRTQTVRFLLHIGLQDAGHDGFPPVAAVHERMRTLHDQNLQLLEACRREHARAEAFEEQAVLSEKRFNIAACILFCVVGLVFGYLLAQWVLKWMP